MISTQLQPINITLVFGDISRQTELDAVIKLIPNNIAIPCSGGRNGTAGTAVLGDQGELPPTIWCVRPTQRRVDTVDLLAQAMRQGLQRAAIRGFQRVGIELDEPPRGSVTSLTTMVKTIVETVDSFARHSFRFDEFRLVAADSRVVVMARHFMKYSLTHNDR